MTGINPPQQITEQERAYWFTHAFRVLPPALAQPCGCDFGTCALVLGANLATFDGVHFRDCEVTLRSGAKTTVLAFVFRENPAAVFCLLPEEIVFMEPVPPATAAAAAITLGFVPRPDLQDDCGIAFSSTPAAVQLAQAVTVHGPVKLTLCGVSSGLLTYLRELHAWQLRTEKHNAAASLAMVAPPAAAAAAVTNPTAATAASAAVPAAYPAPEPRMAGSLPNMQPSRAMAGMGLRRGMPVTSASRTLVTLEDAALDDEDEDEDEDDENDDEDEQNLAEQVLTPVPVAPAPAPAMLGIDSLVKAASIVAPSPMITPPLFVMSTTPTVASSQAQAAQQAAQAAPQQTAQTPAEARHAPPQQFSPFSSITPGLRTPELDEEAVAVLQRCAQQKRRKSAFVNFVLPAAQPLTAPFGTPLLSVSGPPLPLGIALQVPATAAATVTAQAPAAQAASAMPAAPPERKAGRFKIPPEQRHRRAYSQGVHGAGAHAGAQGGSGLSSFCGAQDGTVQGLHQCKWQGCNLTFGVLSVLTTHLQSHTLASSDFVCRWEGCPRQGKPFSNHSGLFRHLRYHTGDKPCKCPVEGCGFSSVDNGELNRHIKLVHRT